MLKSRKWPSQLSRNESYCNLQSVVFWSSSIFASSAADSCGCKTLSKGPLQHAGMTLPSESNYKRSHSDQILQARENLKKESHSQTAITGFIFATNKSSSPLHSNRKVRASQGIETSPPFLFSQGAQQDEKVSQL